MHNGWILMMATMTLAGYMSEKLRERIYVAEDEQIFRNIYCIEVDVMICLFCTFATISMFLKEIKLFLWAALLYGALYLIIYIYMGIRGNPLPFGDSSPSETDDMDILLGTDPDCRAYPLPSDNGFLWRVESTKEAFTMELDLECSFPEKWKLVKRDDEGESVFATIESVVEGCIYELFIEKGYIRYLCKTFLFDHGKRIEVYLDLFQVAKLELRDDGNYDIWIIGDAIL